MAIPIYEDEVWSTLSVTNQHERGQSQWTGFFRSSLNKFSDSDGSYLMELLTKQEANPRRYPLTEKDKRQLAGRRKVRTLDREVEVEIPEGDEDDTWSKSTESESAITTGIRESIRMQAKVAQIGADMGFRIWVPRNDKAHVLESIPPGMHEKFLDALPLN